MEVERDKLAMIHMYVSNAEGKAKRWRLQNKVVAEDVIKDLGKALELFDIILGGM